jgi:hypothetical protein
MTLRSTSTRLGLAILAAFLPTPQTQAAAPNGTTAIAQDWRVELYTVSAPERTTCPLFVSAMALPNLTTLFQVTWNHRDLPSLEQGGIQLQAYRWLDLIEAADVTTPPWRDKLSHDNEIVTWTQVVSRDGMSHVFTVGDIVGNTWGTITEKYSVRRTYLFFAPTLESYDVAIIKENSGIVMGTNRFKKLAIVETRFYNDAGELLGRDANEHIIFAQPQSYSYFEDQRLGD